MEQNEKLNQRRKVKADRMQIKKLRIERDQLEAVSQKEIELNQQKFDKQITEMEKVVEKEIDRDVQTHFNQSGPGKEQALVLVNEVYDDLHIRKLKVLMSKQFFDLSKSLAALQSFVGMDKIIKCKEIEQRFEREKDKTLKTVPKKELEGIMDQIGAQMDLEMQLMEEEMSKMQQLKESEMRQNMENKFFNEKKLMAERTNDLKKHKLRNAMGKAQDDKTLQEVGRKML